MESRRTAAADISTLLPGQSCCFLMLPSKREKCLECEEREYSVAIQQKLSVPFSALVSSHLLRSVVCCWSVARRKNTRRNFGYKNKNRIRRKCLFVRDNMLVLSFIGHRGAEQPTARRRRLCNEATTVTFTRLSVHTVQMSAGASLPSKIALIRLPALSSLRLR